MGKCPTAIWRWPETCRCGNFRETALVMKIYSGPCVIILGSHQSLLHNQRPYPLKPDAPTNNHMHIFSH